MNSQALLSKAARCSLLSPALFTVLRMLAVTRLSLLCLSATNAPRTLLSRPRLALWGMLYLGTRTTWTRKYFLYFAYHISGVYFEERRETAYSKYGLFSKQAQLRRGDQPNGLDSVMCQDGSKSILARSSKYFHVLGSDRGGWDAGTALAPFDGLRWGRYMKAKLACRLWILTAGGHILPQARRLLFCSSRVSAPDRGHWPQGDPFPYFLWSADARWYGL